MTDKEKSQQEEAAKEAAAGQSRQEEVETAFPTSVNDQVTD